MKKHLLLISLLLLAASPAPAQGFRSESFSLSNGMQVVVIPNTKVPAVSHMVWYRVGAQDEVSGKSGIAHFLEHLMFKGTKKYGQGQFSRLVAKAGGDDNAFTSDDYTAYYQNISRDKLELVMELESDRMQNLLLQNDEVLKERQVILEERFSRIENNPSALLAEQMRAALYRNHPYGIPLIGWKHEMEALTSEDAKKWYDTYYKPNNAILVVSGDITAAELKPLAEKYYGKIKAGNIPERKLLQEPPAISPINLTLTDEKVTSPEWNRYYIAPSRNYGETKYSYPLVLLSRILGDGNTSRLYKSLVVKDEAAVGISTYYEDLKLGPSIFAVSAAPAVNKSLDEIEAKIDAEIEKIKKGGVTEDELKRAKNALIAETIYAREDLKTLGYIYGQAVITGAGTQYVESWQDNIHAVTASDIKEAANYVLKAEGSVTGRLMMANSK